MAEATHAPENLQTPASEAPKRRKDTRKGDRHSPGYQREWMRRYRAKKKADGANISVDTTLPSV